MTEQHALNDDEEEYSDCDVMGHDDVTVHEDDDTKVWNCRRCGAEGWENKDD